MRDIPGSDVFLRPDIENILRSQMMVAETQFRYAGAQTAEIQAYHDGYCTALFALAVALNINPRSLEAHVQTQPAQRVFERPRNWRRE